MLTKYSLQKQLVIIFSIIAIGVLAILLPIIDNNLTHVIDNEMYDVLTRSQMIFTHMIFLLIMQVQINKFIILLITLMKIRLQQRKIFLLRNIKY